MLKKSITFEDFDGNELTEDFYFNLSKAELIELELSSQDGLAEHLKALIESKDREAIVAEFKKIILMSYGEKSADGRRFIKSDELREEFEQTNAFSELFIELATNMESAVEFIKGIIPASLGKDLDAIGETEAETDPNAADVQVLRKTTQADLQKATKAKIDRK